MSLSKEAGIGQLKLIGHSSDSIQRLIGEKLTEDYKVIYDNLQKFLKCSFETFIQKLYNDGVDFFVNTYLRLLNLHTGNEDNEEKKQHERELEKFSSIYLTNGKKKLYVKPNITVLEFVLLANRYKTYLPEIIKKRQK